MTFVNVQNPQRSQCAPSNAAAAGAETFVRPPHRIREVDSGFEVEVDLPGVGKDGLEAKVHEGVLEITGRRSWSRPESWKPLAAKTASPSRLRLALGDQVDEAKIAASLVDGLLALSLPKRESVQPRRIAVN